jgi:hypothetical protein
MSKIPSVMNHDFSRVPRADIPRSSFDRSHGLKTTFDAGRLVPIFWDEALPGDTFNLNLQGFARLATPLHPFMDNMFMNTFFFAVPLRLLWDNFQRFMGEQPNPDDSTDFLVPQIVAPVGGYQNGTIYDYFGLPTQAGGISHSALYLRAYNLIWNEWFRDQNLQDSVIVPKDDGPDGYTAYNVLHRGKRHDYFTSSLPWPQKGPAVQVPLGEYAPIIGLGVPNEAHTVGPSGPLREQNGVRNYANYRVVDQDSPDSQLYVESWHNPDNDEWFPDIRADLRQATASTINQLRQAFQIQKLYERDARGGTRYTEIIRAHFNVVSPDARLQRPEYLGGGQTPINLYAVPQTSSADTQPTPQGNLAAYGTANIGGHGFSKSFTEHCVVIGLVSVRADLNYQQGINRAWSRRTKYDYYWPALAMIGEQAVLSKEIYADGTADDDLVWGYQERFAEYRYKPSTITGQMRSNYAQSLDTWHLAQEFLTRPVLDAAFIIDNPPVDRVVAVPTEPDFIFDAFVKLRCARPMPIYGVPGLIDHF